MLSLVIFQNSPLGVRRAQHESSCRCVRKAGPRRISTLLWEENIDYLLQRKLPEPWINVYTDSTTEQRILVTWRPGVHRWTGLDWACGTGDWHGSDQLCVNSSCLLGLIAERDLCWSSPADHYTTPQKSNLRLWLLSSTISTPIRIFNITWEHMLCQWEGMLFLQAYLPW